jgi:HPr kinase/phosphorylase
MTSATLHATTIAIDGCGVLIAGPSGSGKSSLALRLIALGASLVADDRTIVTLTNERLIATAPDPIAGLIEARGVGLLRAPLAPATPLYLVVDLAAPAAPRLPEPQYLAILGQLLPCLHNGESAHFPAAIMLYVRGELKETR